MSAQDLGRFKNGLKKDVRRESAAVEVSGCDRSDLRLDADNVYDPCQIIAQDRERHLARYFWSVFGKEVRGSHASLHRAERMFDWRAEIFLAH